MLNPEDRPTAQGVLDALDRIRAAVRHSASSGSCSAGGTSSSGRGEPLEGAGAGPPQDCSAAEGRRRGAALGEIIVVSEGRPEAGERSADVGEEERLERRNGYS